MNLNTKRIAIVLAALVLVVCLLVLTRLGRDGEHAITNARPTGTTIIAFGDSITYGTGAAPHESYPQQLARLLDVEILNHGVPGDTTASALTRLQYDVLAYDPRIVLLCLGGNDFLRRVDRESTFANLEQIITRIQDHGALVILIGVDFPFGSPTREYRELARRTGCPHVPEILRGILNDSTLMSDAIHPNATGYERIAGRVAPVLRPYVNASD